jgi:integrase
VAERKKAEAETRRQRLEKTVDDLWDRYRKEVMAVANKPRTVADKNRLWKQRIRPALGHLKVQEVTEEDAGAVVRAPLRLDANGRVIGGKAEAGNTYRLLHHMFRKALQWGLRPREAGNPLENVVEPKTSRRERLLAPGEIGALLKALERAATENTEEPQIIAAVQTVILTGARISELLALQWDHIRPEETELHLPDTKTGFSRRPISTETLAVLEASSGCPARHSCSGPSSRPLSRSPTAQPRKHFVGLSRRLGSGATRSTLSGIGSPPRRRTTSVIPGSAWR